jgi:hypothetical protein
LLGDGEVESQLDDEWDVYVCLVFKAVTTDDAILIRPLTRPEDECVMVNYTVARWRGRVQTVLGQCGVTHRAGVDARDPALVVN